VVTRNNDIFAIICDSDMVAIPLNRSALGSAAANDSLAARIALTSFQFEMPELTITNVVNWIAATAMIFGGVVPFIPQYLDIRKSQNAEGFSTYVCLALLIANTLRILFWFGKFFELPLLAQSIFMLFMMMLMLHLCVSVRNKTELVSLSSAKRKTFLQMNFRRDFWQWTDFISYVQFMFCFGCFGVFLMYCFVEFTIFVETVGFLAVFVEAMLGMPQFWRNWTNGSTQGMSVKMVLFWLSGDVFKTIYFLLRNAPLQFFLCGALQVSVDIAILCQVLIYRDAPLKQKMNVL